MNVVHVRSWLRPLIVTSSLVVLASGSSYLRAEQTPVQTPAPAAQAPQADPFKFDADSALVILTIAPEAAADFETTMTKTKEALSRSTDEKRKEQAAHWKFLKADAQQNGMNMYLFALDKVVRDASYNPFTILGEGGMPPADVKALYDKVVAGLKGINLLSYKVFADMTSGG